MQCLRQYRENTAPSVLTSTSSRCLHEGLYTFNVHRVLNLTLMLESGFYECPLCRFEDARYGIGPATSAREQWRWAGRMAQGSKVVDARRDTRCAPADHIGIRPAVEAQRVDELGGRPASEVGFALARDEVEEPEVIAAQLAPSPEGGGDIPIDQAEVVDPYVAEYAATELDARRCAELDAG